MWKLFKDNKAYANIVPLILAVVISFALLFIGAFVNGTIHEELEDNVDSGSKSIATMKNITYNFDSTLDIVQVTIIITVLATAIGAIFLFTRFRM